MHEKSSECFNLRDLRESKNASTRSRVKPVRTPPPQNLPIGSLATNLYAQPKKEILEGLLLQEVVDLFLHMLTNKNYLLEKFPGKGGWTYARIPEVKPDKHNHFGWVRVRGSIDGYEFKNYNLQPMGDGRLFIPVKAAIRKQIKKQAGDYVHIILFADDQPTEIPEELIHCMSDEPGTLEKFNTLTNGKKKRLIEWIYDARTTETRATRIVQLIQDLLNNKY